MPELSSVYSFCSKLVACGWERGTALKDESDDSPLGGERRLPLHAGSVGSDQTHKTAHLRADNQLDEVALEQFVACR